MKWIDFVKDFAKKNKMKYNEALKSAKLKEDWAKHKDKTHDKKPKKEKKEMKEEKKKMKK